MNWIKCAERLPEVDERVLICTKKKEVLIGIRSTVSRYYDFCADHYYTTGYECEVEHYNIKQLDSWMPLPAPPEGE